MSFGGISRLLERYGRKLTLRDRPGGTVTAEVIGVITQYAPNQIVGDIKQTDAMLTLTADLGSFPLPLRSPNVVEDGGTFYTITFAHPIKIGDAIIAWRGNVSGA